MIVSTGAQSLMLGLEAESRLIGHGLSTCATCDGFFFRGHEIAVVGGGDSAVEEATFLTKFADKVTLIHRRDTLRASKIMQERALANPKIELAVEHHRGRPARRHQARRRGVRDVVTGEERDLPVTGVFVAIGHRPNTDLFKGVLEMDDNGYLITRPGSSATERRRRLRLRRRAGPHLPPGHHRRRLGLHGRHRRRALARSGRTPLRVFAMAARAHRAEGSASDEAQRGSAKRSAGHAEPWARECVAWSRRLITRTSIAAHRKDPSHG